MSLKGLTEMPMAFVVQFNPQISYGLILLQITKDFVKIQWKKTLKNANNYWNAQMASIKNSEIHLNAVGFFTAASNQTSVAASK